MQFWKRLKRWFSWIDLKNYKIEHKLLLTYPLLILISIIVVSTFTIYFSMQHLEERATTYAETILKQISHNIDNELSRIDKDTYVFFHNYDVKDFFKSAYPENSQEFNEMYYRLRQFQTNFLLTHPNIESIYLINSHNEVMTTSNRAEVTGRDEIRRQAATGNGRVVWLPAKMSTIGNAVVPFARDIKDLSTLETNGVLLVNYYVSAFHSVLSDHDIGVKGDLFVLDTDGTVVVSPSGEEPTEQFGKRMDAEMLAKINSAQGSFTQEEADGIFHYVYYTSEFTNWKYLFRMNQSELYHGIERVRNFGILTAAIFSLLAIFSARVIAVNISRPIHKVVKEMKYIERNNLLVNLQYDGKDELFTLATAFNHMMNRVREMMRKESELQRMQHELEMRALQAEINPHFLYNTLETINWKARIHNIPEISEMTTMLADIMRYSISYRHELVMLWKEIEHVRKYTGIQEMRYQDRLKVFYDIPEEIMQASIPKLTLQPRTVSYGSSA